MNDHERNRLEAFFKVIEPNLPGFGHAYFSYLALKNGDAFELAQGRLQLQGVPAPIPSRCFESENIKVGIFRLTELELSPRLFVEKLFTGKLKTPEGDLLFPCEKGQHHSIYFDPYFRDETALQHRQLLLRVGGGKRLRSESGLLDWELKAAPTPYFNVQELCDEFLVGLLSGDSAYVDVIAMHVAVVANDSTVDGTTAKLAVILADGLDISKTTLGYRVFDKNKVVKRGSFLGSDLKWKKADGVWRGNCELDVPVGAVLDCTASYSGVAQNHRWISDPKTSQNPLRSVHHAFDNNLEVLRELVARAQNRGANARDLEMAVSWLLWMLGFSVTHIGGTPRTSDAPDLIATTPRGDFMVIECTTGILKEDSKLPHLIQRAEKVRQNLAVSGHQYLKVLPIIVTTKTREEVKSEIGEAHKHGVLVATIEDFQPMVDRTMLLPNPLTIFAEVEETLRKYQNPSPFSELADK